MSNKLDKVKRIQELRRSNAASYVPSIKEYSRKGKQSRRVAIAKSIEKW